MANSGLLLESIGAQNSEIFGDDTSKLKTIAVAIDGIPTDIVFGDYSDKHFLIITQYQKVGTFISVTKGAAKNLIGADDIYDIKTLCGLDKQEYHLVARYLSEQLNIFKPILFSICLQDYSLKTLKVISKVLKENNIL